MAKSNSVRTKIAVVLTEIKFVKKEVKEMKQMINDLSNKFVTKNEFDPVKNIVYGAVALILTTVTLAVIGLVVINRI